VLKGAAVARQAAILPACTIPTFAASGALLPIGGHSRGRPSRIWLSPRLRPRKIELSGKRASDYERRSPKSISTIRSRTIPPGRSAPLRRPPMCPPGLSSRSQDRLGRGVRRCQRRRPVRRFRVRQARGRAALKMLTRSLLGGVYGDSSRSTMGLSRITF
jgi:hypothetical protein